MTDNTDNVIPMPPRDETDLDAAGIDRILRAAAAPLNAYRRGEL